MCWINDKRFAWNKVPEELSIMMNLLLWGTFYYWWENYLWNRSMWPGLEHAKKIQSSKLSQRKSKSRALKSWETISRKWQENPTHLRFHCRRPGGDLILETFSLGLISVLREQNWARKRVVRFTSPQIEKQLADMLTVALLPKHSQGGTFTATQSRLEPP